MHVSIIDFSTLYAMWIDARQMHPKKNPTTLAHTALFLPPLPLSHLNAIYLN